MEEFEKDFLRQHGTADQQAARTLERLEKVKGKYGIEQWLKTLAQIVAEHEDLIFGAETVADRTIMEQIGPILSGVYQDPILKELYEKAYQQELKIQEQQRGK